MTQTRTSHTPHGPLPALTPPADQTDQLQQELHRLWLIDPAPRKVNTVLWAQLLPAGPGLVRMQTGTGMISWSLNGPENTQPAAETQERLLRMVPGDVITDAHTSQPVRPSPMLRNLISHELELARTSPVPGALTGLDVLVSRHAALVVTAGAGSEPGASVRRNWPPRLNTEAALSCLSDPVVRQMMLHDIEPIQATPLLFGQGATRKDTVKAVARATSLHLQLARALWHPGLPEDWLVQFLTSLAVLEDRGQLRRSGANRLAELLAQIPEDRLRRRLLLKDLTAGSGAQGQALTALARLVHIPEGLDLDGVTGWRELHRAVQVSARAERLKHLTDRAEPERATNPADYALLNRQIITGTITTEQLQQWRTSPGYQDWLRARQEADLGRPGNRQGAQNPLDQNADSGPDQQLRTNQLQTEIAEQLRRDLDGRIENGLLYRVAISDHELKSWGGTLGHCIGSYGHRLNDRHTLLVAVYEEHSNMLSSTMEIVVGQDCTVRIIQDQGKVNNSRRAPHKEKNRQLIEKLVDPGLMQ